MDIAVGTADTSKVKGVEAAFRKFFPEAKINIFPYDLEFVPKRTPRGEGDICRCCRKSIEQTRHVLFQDRADYFVGVASGLAGDNENFCIQMAQIVRSDGMEAWGKSSGYEVPEELMQNVMEKSLKTVMKNEFVGRDVTAYLSNDLIDSSRQTEDAVIMALGSMKWKVLTASKQFK